MTSGRATIRTNKPGETWFQMLRPFWSIAVLALVVIFAWRQRAELVQAVRELRLADWRWLVAIVVSALIVQMLATQALSAIFLQLGRRIPFVPALMTQAERTMLATVMPFGSAASYPTLVARFSGYGVDRNEAMLAVMLYSLIGHLSFIAVAIPAMVLLVQQHNATTPMQIGAGVVLVVAFFVLAAVTALQRGMRLPSAVEGRLPGFVQDFREMAQSTSVSPRSLVVPFVFSLTADLCGVLSLWTALRAVRVDAGLETALVAYAAATMLALAAPVFQGLGIVEVSVIFLLERLGVPLPQAIGATVLYRFVDVWIPVLLGVGVHARYQRALRGLPAYLPALWTALSGAIALVSVLPPAFHIPHHDLQRADGFGLLYEHHRPRTFTLVAGFLLLVLALRLLRRQRSAWVFALLLSGLLTAQYLGRDFDAVGALVSGTNVAILLMYRSKFRVRSDIPSLRRGLSVLAVTFTATYLFGVASLWLADKRHFGREFSIASSLRTTVDIYFGFGSGGLVARTARAEWIIDSIHLLAALSIIVSTLALLHPIVWRHRVQRAETERARRLIEQYGDSSLDRFKYWPDKLQFFAADGGGVVSYGLNGRVALVLGDPSAKDESAFERTLDEFLDFCEINGWEPAFHQAPSNHLDSYRQRGFTSLLVGRDAIVPLEGFTLPGKSMGSFRSARNRAQREGRNVEYTEAPLPDELVRELGEVSGEWLTLEGRRERTFTLGQFDSGYIRGTPVLVLRSASGRAEAFVNLIPDGAPGELTFDLMRHRVDARNGSMDLLMLAMIDLGKERGHTSLSLGMVPFVNPDPTEAMAATDRIIAQLARPMGRFFASESLFAYKDKFHPRWEPRYLMVRSVSQLPRVALALTRLSETDERGFWRRLISGTRWNPGEQAEPVVVTEVTHAA